MYKNYCLPISYVFSVDKYDCQLNIINKTYYINNTINFETLTSGTFGGEILDYYSFNGIDDYIEIPESQELISPILANIPLQLLSYYIANFKGCSIDQPRNLAKSVTVE